MACVCVGIGWVIGVQRVIPVPSWLQIPLDDGPGQYEARCLHAIEDGVSDAPGMVYYAKYWDDESACGDRALLGYIDASEAMLPVDQRKGLRIFHLGTGGHHLIGLANRMRPQGIRHSIYAITASPEEYSTYMSLCIKDGALGQNYHVWFGDAYNLKPEFLPDDLDLVLVPHLGEYYTVVNHSEPRIVAPGMNTDRSTYALLDDRKLLDLLVGKMARGGRLLSHNLTSGWYTASTLIGDLVDRGILLKHGTDGTVDAYVKQ